MNSSTFSKPSKFQDVENHYENIPVVSSSSAQSSKILQDARDGSSQIDSMFKDVISARCGNHRRVPKPRLTFVPLKHSEDDLLYSSDEEDEEEDDDELSVLALDLIHLPILDDDLGEVAEVGTSISSFSEQRLKEPEGRPPRSPRERFSRDPPMVRLKEREGRPPSSRVRFSADTPELIVYEAPLPQEKVLLFYTYEEINNMIMERYLEELR